MKNINLNGTITALVTPFNDDFSIDYKALDVILDYQLDSDISGLVVLGSTGEAATLNSDEKLDLILKVQEKVAGKVPIIVGAGSNDTRATIDMVKLAEKNNFDAVLLVCPYYNKPTNKGLFEHFNAISEAVDIPQILYNVPGRTGLNINAETQIRIATECKNVIATKEASGNLEQMMEIIKSAPKDFTLLSGDDALTIPCICAGGKGIISVISNYAPKMFSKCVNLALQGDYKNSIDLHYKLFDYMQVNFIESNPAPVKAMMAELGLIKNNLRLPLVPVSENSKARIVSLLNKQKVN